MSNVVKSKKNPDECEALNFAEDLLQFTFDICHREKKVKSEKPNENAIIRKSAFPLKYWSCFTCYLIEYASLAYDNLYMANITNLFEDYEERRNKLNKSIMYLKSMLPKIHFAWHRFSIQSNSIEFWTKLVVQAIDKTNALKRSDEKRYKEYLTNLATNDN